MNPRTFALLESLVARFDPGTFDAPSGHARIRLVVADDGVADVLADADGAVVVAADASRTPDATLPPPLDDWQRMLADARSGLAANEAGRLVIR